MDVVFTDLDGTLLDSDDYTYESSMEAVRALQKKNIPIIFCSAKTKAEQEFYRRNMGIRDPFIVEDGSAVMIPKGYFSSIDRGRYEDKEDYDVIVLGANYRQVRKVAFLLELRCDARIYGRLSADEIASLSGLSTDMANMAKKREYSETLLIDGDHLDMSKQIVDEHGLTMTHGGRFHTLKGNTDKGRATKTLLDIYCEEFGDVRSIGIGNSQNDIPLLRAVDVPYFVESEHVDCEPDFSRFRRAESFEEFVAEILA